MRSSKLRTWSCVCCLLGISIAACNEKDRYAGIGDGIDASTRGDAAADGGIRLDAGPGFIVLPDGAVISVGPPTDAAVDDEDGGTKDEIDPTESCDVAKDFAHFEKVVADADDSRFSLTTGPAGFGFAFHADPGSDEIDTMAVDGAGKFGKPVALFSNDAVRILDLSLLWTTDGWHLAWVDNFTMNTGELQTMLLTDALKRPTGTMRTTLTSNALAESRPVFADIAGVPTLAWIMEDAPGTGVRIASKRFEATSDVIDLVGKAQKRIPTRLALAQMGTSSAALAWVEEEGKPGVWLQKIDEAGKPSGDPLRMSEFAGAGATIDLATRDDDGGAALFSVEVGGGNHEVRFRRLDETGGFEGQAMKIIGSPLQARDASIARLGGGYVVVYRALVGGVVTKPGIRMTFITKEGNPTLDKLGRLVTYPVTDTDSFGGRTTVRVSLDGQVLIAYASSDGVQQKVHLVRQRLDCAR